MLAPVFMQRQPAAKQALPAHLCGKTSWMASMSFKAAKAGPVFSLVASAADASSSTTALARTLEHLEARYSRS